MGPGGSLGPSGPLSGLVPPPPLSAGGAIVGGPGGLNVPGVSGASPGYGASSCAVSSQPTAMLTTTMSGTGAVGYAPPPNSHMAVYGNLLFHIYISQKEFGFNTLTRKLAQF